jgi:hypothetical protein
VMRRGHLRRNPLALLGLTDPSGLIVCAPLSSLGTFEPAAGVSFARDRIRVGM